MSNPNYSHPTLRVNTDLANSDYDARRMRASEGASAPSQSSSGGQTASSGAAQQPADSAPAPSAFRRSQAQMDLRRG